MRCRRCSHELSAGADRCLRCFALNPQNTEERALPATGGARGASNGGPLFAGLDSDPPKEVRLRFDDEPDPGKRLPAIEKTPAPPKARKPRAPAPVPLPFVEFLKTPAPPAKVEPVTDP